MPGSTLDDVRRKAEELLEAFRRHSFIDGRTRKAGKLSLSLGITQLREGMTGEELLDEADSALYDAKRQGKDCLVVIEGDGIGGA